MVEVLFGESEATFMKIAIENGAQEIVKKLFV